MLKWALIFLVIGLVAGAAGFSGIAGAAVGVAQILFFLFLAIALLMFLAGSFLVKKVVS